jgi:hypothetical protein
MEFIDRMPPVEIDAETKDLYVRVDGGEKFKLSLIQNLVADGERITIEKFRVFVPGFKFESPWENLIGSDKPSEDEATEDYDHQRSNIFLDKKTRKPLLYRFVVDKQGNLYFESKRTVETT